MYVENRDIIRFAENFQMALLISWRSVNSSPYIPKYLKFFDKIAQVK
jgi:hypothetical protein